MGLVHISSARSTVGSHDVRGPWPSAQWSSGKGQGPADRRGPSRRGSSFRELRVSGCAPHGSGKLRPRGLLLALSPPSVRGPLPSMLLPGAVFCLSHVRPTAVAAAPIAEGCGSNVFEEVLQQAHTIAALQQSSIDLQTGSQQARSRCSPVSMPHHLLWLWLFSLLSQGCASLSGSLLRLLRVSPRAIPVLCLAHCCGLSASV